MLANIGWTDESRAAALAVRRAKAAARGTATAPSTAPSAPSSTTPKRTPQEQADYDAYYAGTATPAQKKRFEAGAAKEAAAADTAELDAPVNDAAGYPFDERYGPEEEAAFAKVYGRSPASPKERAAAEKLAAGPTPSPTPIPLMVAPDPTRQAIDAQKAAMRAGQSPDTSSRGNPSLGSKTSKGTPSLGGQASKGTPTKGNVTIIPATKAQLQASAAAAVAQQKAQKRATAPAQTLFGPGGQNPASRPATLFGPGGQNPASGQAVRFGPGGQQITQPTKKKKTLKSQYQ